MRAKNNQVKKISRKIAAVMLSLVLALGLMPASFAFAAETGTAGTVAELKSLLASSESEINITLTGNITFAGPSDGIVIPGGKTVSIDGDGFAIDAANQCRAITVESGASLTLADVKVTKGKADGNGNTETEGGGIYNAGNLTLGSDALIGEDVLDTSDWQAADDLTNRALLGGGIYNVGILTMLDGSAVSYNHVILNTYRGGINGVGGGIYNATGGTVNMQGGTVSDNWGNVYSNNSQRGDVDFNGLGLYNSAYRGGGVVNDGAFNMSGGSISNNKTFWQGGGVYNGLQNASAQFTASSGSIDGNRVRGFLTGQTASHANILGNGGGVYNNAVFTLAGTAAVKGNLGKTGAGIYNLATLNIDGGAVTLNSVEFNSNAGDADDPEGRDGEQGYGSGVYNATSGTLSMTDGAISDNRGTSHLVVGAGVFNKGAFAMSGGEIKDNTNRDQYGIQGGGGVGNFGSFTLSGGSISGNEASQGGGINNYGSLNMTGGTISSNKSIGDYGGGGGIYAVGTTTVSGGIIAENYSSRDGGGIYKYSLIASPNGWQNPSVIDPATTVLTIGADAELLGNQARGDGGAIGVFTSGYSGTYRGDTRAMIAHDLIEQGYIVIDPGAVFEDNTASILVQPRCDDYYEKTPDPGKDHDITSVYRFTFNQNTGDDAADILAVLGYSQYQDKLYGTAPFPTAAPVNPGRSFQGWKLNDEAALLSTNQLTEEYLLGLIAAEEAKASEDRVYGLSFVAQWSDAAIVGVIVKGTAVTAQGQVIGLKTRIQLQDIIVPASATKDVEYATDYYPAFPDQAYINSNPEQFPAIGTGPSAWLALYHAYKVTVTYADSTEVSFYIVLDNTKSTVELNAQYLSDANAGQWSAYTNNALVSSAVSINPVPVGAPSDFKGSWPIWGMTRAYRLVSSDNSWVNDNFSTVWTPVSASDTNDPAAYSGLLFDPQGQSFEGTSIFEFQLTSFTGVEATKKLTIRFDNLAPRLIQQPSVDSGYTAYKANATFKFDELNAAGGTVSYNFCDYDGTLIDAVNNPQNIKSVVFNENGLYKDIYVSDAAGNTTRLDDFVIDKTVPTLPAVTATQMYPGVDGSPIIVSLSPSIAAGHTYKLQYSQDNSSWTDFDYLASPAINTAANDRANDAAWVGAWGVYGNSDDEARSALYSKLYRIVFKSDYDRLYQSYIDQGMTEAEAATAANAGANGKADYMAWNGVQNLHESVRGNYYSLIYHSLFDEYYWAEFTASSGAEFVIYPKADEAIGGKHYFRAVNSRSGLLSTVRNCNTVISKGPLVMFGGWGLLAEAGQNYTVGKIVSADSILAYANGIASVQVTLNGNVVTGNLSNNKSYLVTLTYDGGSTVFGITVDTTKPVFGTVVAKIGSKNGLEYIKNTKIGGPDAQVYFRLNADTLVSTFWYSEDNGISWKKISAAPKPDGANVKYVEWTCKGINGALYNKPLRFKAVAVSGAEAVYNFGNVYIDKAAPVLQTNIPGLEDGYTAYPTTQKLVFDKAVTVAYTKDGIPQTLGPARTIQFSGDGVFVPTEAKDEYGNVLDISGMVTAFEISSTKPNLTLKAVSGGRTVSTGAALTADLSFSFTTNFADYRIELSTDGGASWTVLDSNATLNVVADAASNGAYKFRAVNTKSGAAGAPRDFVINFTV